MAYDKIITHNDLDGIVSAALLSQAFGIDNIRFSTPGEVIEGRTGATEASIAADLPYPMPSGMWFDHHAGNLAELKLRGIDNATIAGRREIKDSCARVIWEYFGMKNGLPEFMEETVNETDIVDAFKYSDIEDWKKLRPGRIVANSLLSPLSSMKERYIYLEMLAASLREMPISEVAALGRVINCFREFERLEDGIFKLLGEDSFFLPEDLSHELIVIDLTRHNRKPFIVKSMAFLLHPRAKAVLLINNIFDRGVKTTSMSAGLSLGFDRRLQEIKDVGEIMRVLNMGDGHPGAAGGVIRTSSRKEAEAKKNSIIKEIFRLWKLQQENPVGT